MLSNKLMFRMLCLLWAASLLGACGGKTPPPPKPTHVILDIEASDNVNPNAEGKASPLVLRVYELKSSSDFKKADFITLYSNDKGVLGSELVQKQEIIVQPGEKKTVHFVASDDTRVIGVFAAFRSYEQSKWKGFVNVRPHETMEVHVTAGDVNLSVSD